MPDKEIDAGAIDLAQSGSDWTPGVEGYWFTAYCPDCPFRCSAKSRAALRLNAINHWERQHAEKH